MKSTLPKERKIDIREDDAFALLPLHARGLGAMLLKHCEADGRFPIGTRTPAEAVARRIGAEPNERRSLQHHIQQLLDVGYLRLEEGALVVMEQERRHNKAKARAK